MSPEAEVLVPVNHDGLHPGARIQEPTRNSQRGRDQNQGAVSLVGVASAADETDQTILYKLDAV